MKTHFSQFALLVLVACSGCNTGRLLSRRDYSEMDNPFLEAPAEASSAIARNDSTGRARLGSPVLGSPAPPASGQREPKPITTTAETADYASTGNAGTTAASYARTADTSVRTPAARDTTPQDTIRSHSGPELSDFLRNGGRTPTAAAPEMASAPTVATAGPASAGSLPAPPAALRTAVAQPPAPRDAAAFSAFLDTQDFQIAPVGAGATAAPASPPDPVTVAFPRSAVSTPVQPDRDSFEFDDAPGFDLLAQQAPRSNPSTTPTESAEPLFDVPPRSATASSQPANAGFELDAGWRPAHMIQP